MVRQSVVVVLRGGRPGQTDQNEERQHERWEGPGDSGMALHGGTQWWEGSRALGVGAESTLDDSGASSKKRTVGF